ncbi:MAG: hypothetical protein ABIY70_09845 [Capsulimonas sp.]|uniref:hypothetical protein n=1 Tax=Capsulimonas sp. TaxID=2494211 RepID=UPI003265ED47
MTTPRGSARRSLHDLLTSNSSIFEWCARAIAVRYAGFGRGCPDARERTSERWRSDNHRTCAYEKLRLAAHGCAGGETMQQFAGRQIPNGNQMRGDRVFLQNTSSMAENSVGHGRV